MLDFAKKRSSVGEEHAARQCNLEQVSKFRLERSIEMKQYQKKSVKEKQLTRYTEYNWQQYESTQDLSGIDVQSCQSVELAQQEMLPDRDHRESKLYDKMSIEDSRVSNLTFQRFLLVQNLCFLLAYISLFGNILYSEQEIKAVPLFEVIALYNMTCGTVLLMALTIARYVFLMKLREDQKILREQSNFYEKLCRTGQLWPIVLELLLIIFHPNMLCRGQYITELETYDLTYVNHQVNDMLALCLLIRCYIILRVVVANTKFASPRASRLCRIHLCEPNFMYSVKCILKEYPLRALLTMFMMLLFIFGHGLKLSEGPLKLIEGDAAKMDFTEYTNCFWCIIVTMGTIGYGQYFPRTLPGRFICILAAVAGVILSSLLIVALSAYLTMTPNESKAHICIKRLKLQKSLSDEASSAMISIVNLGRQIKSQEFNEKLYFKEIFANLKKNTEKVKIKMRKIKSLVDNNNIYEEMVRHFSILKNNLKEIYIKQEQIKGDLECLSELAPTKNNLNIANEVEKMMMRRQEK